jgi:hypothetical protein
MNPIDAAQARHAEAQKRLTAAGRELLDVVLTLAPDWRGSPEDVIAARRFEALVEHPAAQKSPLALAWSAYARAARAETKARSALHVARLDALAKPEPVTKPKQRRPSTRMVGFLSYARTLIREEAAA